MKLHLQIPTVKRLFDGEKYDTLKHACSSGRKNLGHVSGGVELNEFKNLPEETKCKRCQKKLAKMSEEKKEKISS